MNLEVNYTIHLLYRAFVPIRKKHDLSVNTILVLNACYIFQRNVGTAFSQSSIRNFITYFNYFRIKYYIGVLLEKKMIYESDFVSYQLYKLTPLGIDVIEGLNGDFQESMVKFCTQYNIQL